MADKKLAKKLAKMSEEDRAAYLEQQRLVEEENQKKKEDMLSRFLKDKLVKEEKASQLNMLKIQDQWREIMRKSKHLRLSFHEKKLPLAFCSQVPRIDERSTSDESDL